MLNELCRELKNWFEVSKEFGTFTIVDGHISGINIAENQYFRIVGSIFNDGVYQYKADGVEGLTDEVFSNGAIWLLAIPKEVINLAVKINAWRAKYDSVDSAALSPFNSESFGGYSYSKSGSASNGTNPNAWQSVFADELKRWRKI